MMFDFKFKQFKQIEFVIKFILNLLLNIVKNFIWSVLCFYESYVCAIFVFFEITFTVIFFKNKIIISLLNIMRLKKFIYFANFVLEFLIHYLVPIPILSLVFYLALIPILFSKKVRSFNNFVFKLIKKVSSRSVTDNRCFTVIKIENAIYFKIIWYKIYCV